MSLNKVILIGRLGKDPEIRSLQDGKEIANFTLATSEKWKDKNSGDRKEKTEWHKVVVFNPALVGVVKSYIKKGSQVYVEGALQTRKWQDKEGKDNYSTEIVLQAFNGTLLMLDGKKEGGQESGGYSDNTSYSTPAATKEDFAAEELDDEIPF